MPLQVFGDHSLPLLYLPDSRNVGQLRKIDEREKKLESNLKMEAKFALETV